MFISCMYKSNKAKLITTHMQIKRNVLFVFYQINVITQQDSLLTMLAIAKN